MGLPVVLPGAGPATADMVGHGGMVRALDVSADGRRVLSGSFDFTARLWDFAGQIEIGVLDAHAGPVTNVAFVGDRRALTAAFRYLLMGTIGATFYIIGVGLMYMMTGTLNIADLATLIPAVADTRTIQAALAFLTVGLSLRLALFPLHMWLPNAYAYAPSVVTVFLAATATKVAV